jgi:hypothetical protein
MTTLLAPIAAPPPMVPPFMIRVPFPRVLLNDMLNFTARMKPLMPTVPNAITAQIGIGPFGLSRLPEARPSRNRESIELSRHFPRPPGRRLVTAGERGVTGGKSLERFHVMAMAARLGVR